MSITAKYIGQSTIQISTTFAAASGNTNMTPFMTFANTVADAMTGAQPSSNGSLSGTAFTADVGVTAQASSGWTLFDSFWGGQNNTAGTSSPIYTQVFRALNADSTTYKNIIFRYNIKEQVINTSTCEYWDSIANYNAGSPSAVSIHSPTNEAWTYFDCAPIGYNLAVCDLILNVTPRWCAVHSYLNNEASLWSGVFESNREDIMDTAAANYPCWGWISSTLWCLGAASPSTRPLAAADHTLLSMPKTRQGYTGVNAAKAWAGDYGVTSLPTWLSTTAAAFIYYLGNNQNKFISNAWDGSRRLSLPIKPISDYSSAQIANYGQIYGLKLVPPIGSNMNKITIPTDSNGNAAAGGTDRTHWLLNCHHKSYSTDTTSWFPGAGTGNSTWVSENIAIGGRPIAMVSTGAAYYCIMNGGASVVKINAITKAYSTVYSTTGITDIKYDGERFIYITSTTAANALCRFDTADDVTAVCVPVTGGFSALSISGDIVTCAPAATATNIIFNRYNKTAQNSAATVAIANASILTANATVVDTGIVKDMTCDFEGNVWAFPSYTTAANARLIKIAYNASTNTTVTGLATAGIGVNFGLQVLNGDNAIAWHAVSAGAIYQVQFSPRTNALIGSVQTVSSISATQSSFQMTAAKIQGALLAVPNNSAQANIFVVNSLGKTITTSLGAPVINIDQGTPNALASAGQFVYFDGARLFTNTDTGLKIYTNVNGGVNVGGNANTTVTMGQVALPA